jgi:hypothetical protein
LVHFEDRVATQLDTTEIEAAVFAKCFVVIAGDIDDAGTFARFAQQLLNDVVVGLGPNRAAADFPEVEDVADQVFGFRVVALREVQEGRALGRIVFPGERRR